MTVTTGTRIGVYQLTEPVGAGGMGEVWRARDTKLGRDVAIKILPVAFAADPERTARFEREARLLAALNHPNIATIHGVEDASGIVAIVMELVDGLTLADILAGSGLQNPKPQARALPLGDALNIARQTGGCFGRGARAGHRPPGPQARQRQRHGQRRREGASTSAWPRLQRRKQQVKDAALTHSPTMAGKWHAGGPHSRHRGGGT